MIKITEGSIIEPIPTEEEYTYKVNRVWKVTPPQSFFEFLKKYNCAEPIDFEIEANRIRLVTRFFGIVKKEYSNGVNRYYDIGCVQSTAFGLFYYDEDATSFGLMPFAELFGGDFLCLDKGKNNEYEENPRVCVLSHEESGECNPVTYHVADSFDEFVEKYHIL